MFWKRKEKFDRIQAYLDKAGIAEGAEKPLEGTSCGAVDLLNLCVKDGDSASVLAQVSGSDTSSRRRTASWEDAAR